MPAAGAWGVSKAHVLTTPSRRPLTQRLLFQKGPRTDAPIVAPSSELADESEQKIGSIALRPHVALKPTQCHLARQSASTPGSVPGDLGRCVENALLSEGGRGWCWRRRPVPGPRDPSELNSGGGVLPWSQLNSHVTSVSSSEPLRRSPGASRTRGTVPCTVLRGSSLTPAPTRRPRPGGCHTAGL